MIYTREVMSTIALTSLIGCVIIGIIEPSLRREFFDVAAANLGAYMSLQTPKQNNGKKR